jgi:predicted aldo/keto reductase-like oxidoreductase
VEHKGLFDENWEVFQGSWELTDEEKERIEEIRQIYDMNFCRRCDYCQPCPEDIPIQAVLDLRSMVKRMGRHILREGWLKGTIEKARGCSECEECMARCPMSFPSRISSRKTSDGLTNS